MFRLVASSRVSLTSAGSRDGSALSISTQFARSDVRPPAVVCRVLTTERTPSTRGRFEERPKLTCQTVVFVAVDHAVIGDRSRLAGHEGIHAAREDLAHPRGVRRTTHERASRLEEYVSCVTIGHGR